MEPDIKNKLDEHDLLLKKIFESTERTRKYILWTAIAGIAMFIVPLIALMFMIPAYLKTIDLSNIGL
jgi:hypothetical protein